MSGALAVAAFDTASDRRDRQVGWINMAGCVAFGLSAAALLALPRFRKRGGALRQSPA